MCQRALREARNWLAPEASEPMQRPNSTSRTVSDPLTATTPFPSSEIANFRAVSYLGGVWSTDSVLVNFANGMPARHDSKRRDRREDGTGRAAVRRHFSSQQKAS